MFISQTAECTHHVGAHGLRKNSRSHIDASHSRQPLVKGERLVRFEVNAVMAVHIKFVFQFLVKYTLLLLSYSYPLLYVHMPDKNI